MKSFLRLRNDAPTPALHFLLSEPPVECKHHFDIFALFYSVWANPQTKIYKIIKHLLQISTSNSKTWAAHIRYLSKLYQMEDPLSCLEREAPTKISYKSYYKTKNLTFHEKELRTKALNNSKMKYFNVNTFGLTGNIHPVISYIYSACDFDKGAQCTIIK